MMGDGLLHRVPKWATLARLTRELGLLASNGVTVNSAPNGVGKGKKWEHGRTEGEVRARYQMEEGRFPTEVPFTRRPPPPGSSITGF